LNRTRSGAIVVWEWAGAYIGDRGLRVRCAGLFIVPDSPYEALRRSVCPLGTDGRAGNAPAVGEKATPTPSLPVPKLVRARCGLATVARCVVGPHTRLRRSRLRPDALPTPPRFETARSLPWVMGSAVAKRIQILLVEDNRLLRDAISAMLAEQPDLKVVAAVDTAPAALEQAGKVKPAVVLVDAALGDHDSHRLVSAIKHAAPEVRIIVMDVLPVPEDVHDFVNRGVSGFIAKDSTLDAFVSTIRSVASGTDVLPSALTNTLFSHIAKVAVGREQSEVLRALRMTHRERVVFDLVANGLSNKEIAQQVHLATNTVKGHVHNILEKLALHTRLQVAAYARRGGKSEHAEP
jgi:DNA-binding NarL/FixJ family response regulator